MSTLSRPKRYRFEDWLALEEASHVRHELIGGELVAMGGGTDLHNLIALGLRDALKQALGAESTWPTPSSGWTRRATIPM